MTRYAPTRSLVASTPDFPNGLTVGPVLSSKMLGKNVAIATSTWGTKPFDLDYSGTVSATDSLVVKRLAGLVQATNAVIPESNWNAAYGSNYGTKKVGLGFTVGTSNQMLRVVSNLSDEGYSNNVNGVIFGYMGSGPRVIASDYDLETEATNTLRLIADTTIVPVGNVGIGVTAAGAKLDVAGTLRLNGTTAGTNYTEIKSAATPVLNVTYTLPATAPTAGQVLSSDASGTMSWVSLTTGTVTSVAALTIGTAGTDVTSSVATGTTTPVITLNIPTASATNRGVLSSADWTTFNAKQASNANLTAIATMGTPAVAGFLKKFANDTWALDETSYYSNSSYIQHTGYDGADFGGVANSRTKSYALYRFVDADITTGAYTKTAVSITSSGAWTATGAVARALYVTATGATTNYAAIFDQGNVGIGTISPGANLDVKGTLRLSGSTSGYVGFSVPANAGSTTYVLPSADGTNGQVLSTNGTATLSWITASGGASLSTANTWTATQTFAGGTSSQFPATTYGVLSDSYGMVRASRFVQGNLVSNSSITYAPTTANNLLPPPTFHGGTGALTSVGTATTGTSPQGVAVDPTGRFAFVANGSSATVQAYAIDQSTGALTSVGTAATGTSPYGVAVDPTGRFVFVTNQSSNTVQAYTINQSTGALTSVGTAATGTYPLCVAVDPTGRFVYVTNSYDGAGGNTVQAYTINQSTGALTSVGTAATGSYPFGLAVDPTGRFAFVANLFDNTVQAYTINQSTGALTSVGTAATGATPRMVAVDPTGRFAFVTNSGGATVQAYTINQSTGALTSVGTAATGSSPLFVAVDPTGRFAFVANNGSNTVQVYTINQSTGALTSVGTAATGSYPLFVAVDPTGRFAFVANNGSNTVQAYRINNFAANSGTFLDRLIVGTIASPAYSLQLASDSAAKPTSNTWTISSDARMKTVIGPYTRGVADIMALEPKRYRLNGAYGSADDGRVHVSVIAQETQATWPEMIGTYEHTDKDENGVETITELLNLNTNELQWALVNAVKELSARIATLEQRG